MTRAERRAHWESIVKKQAASGLSAASFCRREGINLKSFYHWRRRFEAPAASSVPTLVPVTIVAPQIVEVALPCGAVVKVPSAPATLEMVLGTLLQFEGARDD